MLLGFLFILQTIINVMCVSCMCGMYVAAGWASRIRLVVRESKWPPRRGGYSILGFSPQILTPGTQLIDITCVKLIAPVFSPLSPSHIPLTPAYILALPPLGCVA